MSKLPSLQFYPGDWMKDPALRAVTIAARGLWIDMLCLMHESPRRGYLQHETGKAVTAEQLARMTGCSTDGASLMLQELEDAGVFSRTSDQIIYSRRIVRDERKRQLCSDAGKKGGGNPTFGGAPKGHPKGAPNPSSSSSVSSSTSKAEEPPLPPTGGGCVDPPGFVQFWEAWPSHFRKSARAKCLTHWRSAGLESLALVIVASVAAWRASEQWTKDTGQFIPAPLPWLRDRRWEAAAPPAKDERNGHSGSTGANRPARSGGGSNQAAREFPQLINVPVRRYGPAVGGPIPGSAGAA